MLEIHFVSDWKVIGVSFVNGLERLDSFWHFKFSNYTQDDTTTRKKNRLKTKTVSVYFEKLSFPRFCSGE